jgi:hypothetical protein
MRNEIFTTGLTTDYTVQGPTGLTFGTFAQWEHAQWFAQHNTTLSTTGELYIKRGEDTLETVQEGRHTLDLRIVNGVCCWCPTADRTEVVRMPDGAVCLVCSNEIGYGEEVWDYLRG